MRFIMAKTMLKSHALSKSHWMAFTETNHLTMERARLCCTYVQANLALRSPHIKSVVAHSKTRVNPFSNDKF